MVGRNHRSSCWDEDGVKARDTQGQTRLLWRTERWRDVNGLKETKRRKQRRGARGLTTNERSVKSQSSSFCLILQSCVLLKKHFVFCSITPSSHEHCHHESCTGTKTANEWDRSACHSQRARLISPVGLKASASLQIKGKSG